MCDIKWVFWTLVLFIRLFKHMFSGIKFLMTSNFLINGTKTDNYTTHFQFFSTTVQ